MRTHPSPCALCSPVGRPTRFQLLIWFLAPSARTCRQRALLSRGGKNPDATGGGRLRHILDGGRGAGAARALRPHHPWKTRRESARPSTSTPVRQPSVRGGDEQADRLQHGWSTSTLVGKRAAIRLVRTRPSGVGVGEPVWRTVSGLRLRGSRASATAVGILGHCVSSAPQEYSVASLPAQNGFYTRTRQLSVLV